MLKEKIKESDSALMDKQCKWKNYYFGKKGQKLVGGMLHDSQIEAKNALDETLKNAEALAKADPSGDCWLGKLNSGLLLSEYAWGMQIPVLQ